MSNQTTEKEVIQSSTGEIVGAKVKNKRGKRKVVADESNKTFSSPTMPGRSENLPKQQAQQSPKRLAGNELSDQDTIYHSSGGSDDENESQTDEEFQQMCQDSADRLTGEENAKEFSRDVLKSSVKCRRSGLTVNFLKLIAIRRHMFKYDNSRDKYLETGENTYNKDQHITISNGFQAKPLSVLGHHSFKKLQQEYAVANSTSPVTIDFASLIPIELHTELQVEFSSMRDSDDDDYWLDDPDSIAWKSWPPDTFFFRVFKVYPQVTVDKEGTLEYQISQLKYVHSPLKDFENLNTLFREAIAICKTFADATTQINTVIDMLIKKIKDSGEKGQMIAKDLKKGDPAATIPILWARWKMLHKEIKKAKIVLTTYVGDNRYGDTPVSTDTANLSKRKRKQ